MTVIGTESTKVKDMGKMLLKIFLGHFRLFWSFSDTKYMRKIPLQAKRIDSDSQSCWRRVEQIQ